MSTGVGRAQIGQWYLRGDKGEIFQVTGFDEKSRTIEIQTFDGDIDEIDSETWATLPLGLAEPPEDWTGPVDDVEVEEVGNSQTEMTARDWAAPLQPLGLAEPVAEDWEDTSDSDERDPEGEGVPVEGLILDDPVARQRFR